MSNAARPATSRPHLGYVGVGLMGLPMVRRLVPLGYTITAHDIVAKQVDAARVAGARGASSAAQVVRNAEFVLLNLPTTDAVEQAVFGERGVASAIKPPQLVIDFSTNEVGRGTSLPSIFPWRTILPSLSRRVPLRGSNVLSITPSLCFNSLM
jgi:hypothetical protein